jgi:hypothetical protein
VNQGVKVLRTGHSRHAYCVSEDDGEGLKCLLDWKYSEHGEVESIKEGSIEALNKSPA